jgi:ParB/RepB/Spo0J family partition protein
VTDTRTPGPTESTVVWLPVTSLHPAADNPRARIDTDTDDHRGLVESIRQVGVLVPLTVCFTDEADEYLIVAGHRRHAAALEAEVLVVPALILDQADEDRLAAMLIENLCRVGLDPVEEATGYFRLIDLGFTQAQLAARIGRSPSHVSRRLDLLQLPAEILARVSSGALNLDDASALIPLVTAGAELSRLEAVADHPKPQWAAAKVLTQLRWEQVAMPRIDLLAQWGYPVDLVLPHGGVYCDEVGIEWKAHRRQPCASVVIGRGDEAAVTERAVCLEPARHGVIVGRRGAIEAQRAEYERRLAAASRVMGVRLKRDEVLRFSLPIVVRQLLHGRTAARVAALLEVDDPVKWAGTDPVRGVRVLLAYGLVVGSGEATPETIEILQTFGSYTPA